MDQTINRKRLFYGACLALLVTSMTFAFRVVFDSEFGPNGYGYALKDVGWAFLPAFWGFTAAMMIGGPLADRFGLKAIAQMAFVAHIIGIVVTILSKDITTLFVATCFIGLGNGFVEAAFNPMVASLYPNQKTKMLNRFHVWFPAGILIGGALAFLMIDNLGISWQILMATLFIPTAIYGYMIFNERFPVTERVSMGISEGKMWASLATPLYLFIGFCMLLTAATELGTNQRIGAILGNTGTSAILVLAFINGIMALGRLFGGDLVHRISIPVVLLASAVISTLGLYMMSISTGGMLWVSAAVFAVGITFFWPNMLGFIAEYIPESGALGLSVMGGLGMLSAGVAQPIIGSMLGDPGGEIETAAQVDAAASFLGNMALLPAILIVLFGGLLVYMRSRKGETVLAN
ncbi:MAG: MFS transporter [Bacteroidota bacterium]